MTILKTDQHCVRIDQTNPDHHLYRNNGIWWIHYTRYPNPATSERVRSSLRTRSRKEARRRRDAIFAGFAGDMAREFRQEATGFEINGRYRSVQARYPKYPDPKSPQEAAAIDRTKLNEFNRRLREGQQASEVPLDLFAWWLSRY